MKTNLELAGTHHSVLELPEVKPWPEAVNGAELLDRLELLLKRFVVLPEWAAETLALWILHTYAFPLRDVSTYLGLESPEKRCGKTTLLSVLSELVNRPVVAANISSSALFRVIEETRPTLLIDEADTLLQGNDELRGILNSGYTRKTAYVVRVANAVRHYPLDGRKKTEFEQEDTEETEKDQISGTAGKESTVRKGNNAVNQGATRLVRYSCWCPKVMAAIGRLPDTLADRCIVVRMQRKTTEEECERLRNLEPGPLRQQCARLVADHADEIARARPEVPAILNDRASDVWEPLLALADLAGGTWPEKARRAAVGLTAKSQESSPVGTLLLNILVLIKQAGADRIHSRALVEGLKCMGDQPWLEPGKPINETWLAKRLRPYGIRSKTMWIGEVAAKGYMLEDFREAFRRYISKSEVEALREVARGAVAAKAEKVSESPMEGSCKSQES
jgi:putative DNA primase/helicase